MGITFYRGDSNTNNKFYRFIEESDFEKKSLAINIQDMRVEEYEHWAEVLVGKSSACEIVIVSQNREFAELLLWECCRVGRLRELVIVVDSQDATGYDIYYHTKEVDKITSWLYFSSSKMFGASEAEIIRKLGKETPKVRSRWVSAKWRDIDYQDEGRPIVICDLDKLDGGDSNCCYISNYKHTLPRSKRIMYLDELVEGLKL